MKSPASISLSGDRDDRHLPLLGTGQQTCPPRCTCSGPTLRLQHHLTVWGGNLNSVQDKPSLLSHSPPTLPAPCPCLPGRCRSFTGLLKEPHTLARGTLYPVVTQSPTISILQGWCFASARRGKTFTFTFPVSPRVTVEEQDAANNENPARILWHTEKAIAGQDSSHLALDGTKKTSKPSQTLFYQWRD